MNAEQALNISRNAQAVDCSYRSFETGKLILDIQQAAAKGETELRVRLLDTIFVKRLEKLGYRIVECYGVGFFKRILLGKKYHLIRWN